MIKGVAAAAVAGIGYGLLELAMGGILRIAADVVGPTVEPVPRHPAAFGAQLLHKGAIAVELGGIAQVVGGLWRHFDRAHGHLLVVLAKLLVLVALVPLVDLQNEIQLLVQ